MNRRCGLVERSRGERVFSAKQKKLGRRCARSLCYATLLWMGVCHARGRADYTVELSVGAHLLAEFAPEKED